MNERQATLGWKSIDWNKVEKFINKIQTRIAKATIEGNRKLVRELQRMLTHSYYAKLWAIKKVTTNTGKRTAGVDKVKWETPAKKYNAIRTLDKSNYKPKPLRRVYLTKPNGKKRPLGIATMTDRTMQTIEAMALDPVIESISDKKSFGFRKARSCQDVYVQLYKTLCRKDAPKWILEGDIKACFDEISHNWLLENTPMETEMLKKFLKSGYVYQKELFSTKAGTPQGGPISSILANHTLNGIDELLRNNIKGKDIRRKSTGINRQPKVHLVRYADDFIMRCQTPNTTRMSQSQRLCGFEITVS